MSRLPHRLNAKKSVYMPFTPKQIYLLDAIKTLRSYSNRSNFVTDLLSDDESVRVATFNHVNDYLIKLHTIIDTEGMDDTYFAMDQSGLINPFNKNKPPTSL